MDLALGLIFSIRKILQVLVVEGSGPLICGCLHILCSLSKNMWESSLHTIIFISEFSGVSWPLLPFLLVLCFMGVEPILPSPCTQFGYRSSLDHVTSSSTRFSYGILHHYFVVLSRWCLPSKLISIHKSTCSHIVKVSLSIIRWEKGICTDPTSSRSCNL